MVRAQRAGEPSRIYELNGAILGGFFVGLTDVRVEDNSGSNTSMRLNCGGEFTR